MNARLLISELVGTFALIFIGAGAVVTTGNIVAIAVSHGLVVAAFAYAYGHHSGSHINPAVTFGMLVAGETSIGTAMGYWIAQFLGGILGALALSFLVVGGAESGLGATVLASGISPIQGLIIEAILTFFLVNTIMNTAVSGKAGSFSGLAIGLTLVFCILMGGHLTGASLNPARSFGPALLTGNLGQLWLYFVGPLLGASAAALLYRVVFKRSN